MPADRNLWAEAYAKQSRSDFAVYGKFTKEPALSDIEWCHTLHYLQMACEKIAKAYRFRDTDTPIENLLTSHVAFSRFIENLLKSASIKSRYINKNAQHRKITRTARKLAREIELLAPAVERDKHPQNTEYPWADSGKISIPCEYSFPSVSFLNTHESYTFPKIIETAIIEFDTVKVS